MHIAASFMTMMARPSCTTVRLFGATATCSLSAPPCPIGGFILDPGRATGIDSPPPEAVFAEHAPCLFEAPGSNSRGG